MGRLSGLRLIIRLVPEGNSDGGGITGDGGTVRKVDRMLRVKSGEVDSREVSEMRWFPRPTTSFFTSSSYYRRTLLAFGCC